MKLFIFVIFLNFHKILEITLLPNDIIFPEACKGLRTKNNVKLVTDLGTEPVNDRECGKKAVRQKRFAWSSKKGNERWDQYHPAGTRNY